MVREVTGKDFEDHLVPTRRGQGHLPQEQVAQSPIQA